VNKIKLWIAVIVMTCTGIGAEIYHGNEMSWWLVPIFFGAAIGLMTAIHLVVLLFRQDSPRDGTEHKPGIATGVFVVVVYAVAVWFICVAPEQLSLLDRIGLCLIFIGIWVTYRVARLVEGDRPSRRHPIYC